MSPLSLLAAVDSHRYRGNDGFTGELLQQQQHQQQQQQQQQYQQQQQQQQEDVLLCLFKDERDEIAQLLLHLVLREIFIYRLINTVRV